MFFGAFVKVFEKNHILKTVSSMITKIEYEFVQKKLQRVYLSALVV